MSASTPKETSRLALHSRTGEALAPKAQPGYYPDFSTLAQQNFWDAATRDLVLKRVNEVPPIRFFSEKESRLMQAVLDVVLPQTDRDKEHQIPILNYIDERLHLRRFDGFQFEGMPEDTEAHRRGLEAIAMMATENYRKSFFDLSLPEQECLMLSIRDGKPAGAEKIWKDLPVTRYWILLLQDAVSAYYAHPFAWDEIGFGGPAYPRGYMRLENGQREPWEVNERRYEWAPPTESVSGEFNPRKDFFSEGYLGQGGTH